MRLLFLHGWGFGATIWDALRAALPPMDTVVWDRGYFGAPAQDKPEAPVLAIGHSLGSLLLARDPPAGCVGLVAINGFDRFVGEGLIESESLQRMQSSFATAPRSVLNAFRRRLGSNDHLGEMDAARLGSDLDLLANADARHGMGPTVILQGGRDEILPRPMQERVFPGARRVRLGEAGHLLPQSHPTWCANRIRELLDSLE